MATVIPPLLSGALFGSALTASSVYSPAVILDQLSLTSMVMLKTFITASACSAVIIYVARKAGYDLPCRTNSSYGWFGQYDANIVGGLLQGLGMALTGACPGTVLVQVALRLPSATWTLAGSVVGGLAFAFAADKVRRPSQDDKVDKHTVMQVTKVSDESAILGYEAMLIAVLATIDKLGVSSNGEKLWISPVMGGLLIGVAQVSSVVVSKKTLGVSSAYAEIGGIAKNLTSGKGLLGSYGNILFAIGVMLGAQLASQRLPLPAAAGPVISPAIAVLGGACSIFGARLAGGCTSGHGLSGMATLSISSFITVAGMFGGGIVFRSLLNAL